MAEIRPNKTRLDKLVFDKGLVESREKARVMILEGNVLVNGAVVDKAGALVKTDSELTIKNKMPYVSRGGLKLEHAVRHFHIDVKGKTAMDVGASTGGFSDCLLQNGVNKIYAVDVGYGQFDWILRGNEKIVLLEKTNIRYLDRDLVPDAIDIAAIDVSFISLLKVIPKVSEFLVPRGEIVALIKPQFEAGKKDVGKGGVVKDETVRLNTVEKIRGWAEENGFEAIGTTESPVRGSKGNVEYFIYLRKRT